MSLGTRQFTSGSKMPVPPSMMSPVVFGNPGRDPKSSFEDFNGLGNDKGYGFKQPNITTEIYDAMIDSYNLMKTGGVTFTPDGVSLPTVKYGQTQIPVIEEEALCICLYPMENAFDFIQRVFKPMIATDNVRQIMYRRYQTYTVNTTYVSETGSGTGTSLESFETTFKLKRISFTQNITEDAFYNTENGQKQFNMLLDALAKSYRDHFISVALTLLQQHQAPTFRYSTNDPKLIAKDEYEDFIDNVGTFLRADGNVFDKLSVIMSNKLSNAHLGKVDTVIYPTELDIYFKGLKRVVPMDGQTTSQALDAGLPGSLNRRGDNFQIDNFFPIPSERGPKSLTAMSRAIMTFFIRHCDLTEVEAPISLKWFSFSKGKIVDTTYVDIISKGFSNYFNDFKPSRSNVTRQLLKNIGEDVFTSCDIDPEHRVFDPNNNDAKLSESQSLIQGLDDFVEKYNSQSRFDNLGLRTFSDLPIKYYPTERFIEIARGFLLNNQSRFNENEIRREIRKYRDFCFGPDKYSWREQKKVISECPVLFSLAQSVLKDLDGPLVAEHDQMFDDYRRDEITAFFTYVCLADCYPIGLAGLGENVPLPMKEGYDDSRNINPDGYSDPKMFINDTAVRYPDVYTNRRDVGDFVRAKKTDIRAKYNGEEYESFGGLSKYQRMLEFFENWFVDEEGNIQEKLDEQQRDVILKKMEETEGQFLIDFASSRNMERLAGDLMGLKNWLDDEYNYPETEDGNLLYKLNSLSPGLAITPFRKNDLHNLNGTLFFGPSEHDFVNRNMITLDDMGETTTKTKYKALFNAGLYFGTKLKTGKYIVEDEGDDNGFKISDDYHINLAKTNFVNVGYIESEINFVIPSNLSLMEKRLEEIDEMGEDMLTKGLAVIIMMSAFSKSSLLNMAKRSYPPIINPPHISSVIILAHGINFCQSGGRSVIMGGTPERGYFIEDPVNHMIRYETRANIGGFRIPDSAVFGLIAPHIYKVIGLDKDEAAKSLEDMTENMDINVDAKDIGWFTGLMPNIKDPQLGSTAPPFTIASKHSMFSKRPQEIQIPHINSMVPFWIKNMDFAPDKLTAYKANTDNFPITNISQTTSEDKTIPLAPLFVCQYMIPDNAVYEVNSGGVKKNKNHTRANPLWPGIFNDNAARDITGNLSQSVGNQAFRVTSDID